MDLRRLTRRDSSSGGLEGLETAKPTDAGGRVREQIEAMSFEGVPAAAADLIRQEAAAAAERVRNNVPLDLRGRTGLEALVRVQGRPALAVCGGVADLAGSEAAPWKTRLAQYETPLSAACAAVGRIDLAGAHVGTGFLVAPNLVLTNRHVAEVIAKAYAKPNGEVWLLKAGPPLIDFEREICSTSSRSFKILRIVSAGPEAIDMRIDPKKLDAALLEIDTVSLDGRSQPQPLTLLPPQSRANGDGGEIVSIGYPGTPSFEPAGPVATADERDVLEALKRIFGLTYGVKRISPGEILSRAGRIPDGNKGWVFTHDATTLGGSSGAAVVRLIGGEVHVMGLHFGGAWLKHNYAHLTARIFTSPNVLWRA
jgi:hypothetical protein